MEPNAPATAHYEDDPDAQGHSGPSFQTYMYVFYALCAFTLVSFVSNLIFGQTTTSAGIIMVVAVIKAAFVVAVFMHLKFDWSKLYGIIIPVAILGFMMMIILSIDTVVAWHHYWFGGTLDVVQAH